jgi:DNA-binding NarL/FixJ family response regulator
MYPGFRIQQDSAMPRKRLPIRVLIVSDHPTMVSALVSLLFAHGGMTPVGAVQSNAVEAVYQCEVRQPDVVLINLAEAQADLATIEAMHHYHPGLGIIALDAVLHEDLKRAALEAGAFACLSQPVEAKTLLRALNEAARANHAHSPQEARPVGRPGAPQPSAGGVSAASAEGSLHANAKATGAR